jgi:pyruvate/2-oxoglutarate dehydrogenase complex dihydrolipoamide acyltransferase (E2) component
VAKVTMPQLGESVAEGTIGKWLKQPGDHVAKYEPLLEVITDKVNAEVPSPFEGTLTEILVEEGATVPNNAEIAVIETADGAGTDTPAAGATAPASTAPAPAAASAPAPAAASAPPETSAPAVAPPPNGPAGSDERPVAVPMAVSASGLADTTSANGDPDARMTPAVRRLLREHGLTAAQIVGTGGGGRITREDVIDHVESVRTGQPVGAQSGAPASAPAASGASAPAAAPSGGIPAASAPVARATGAQGSTIAFPDGADEVLVPMTQMRKGIAAQMTRALAVPHAYVSMEVDASNLVRLRESSKRDFQAREGLSLSYVPFVVKASVEALLRHPHFNAQWTDAGLLAKRRVHVGVAVAVEDGLIVPVIRDVDGLSIAGLNRAIADAAARARAGKLRLDDFGGGTFTIDNTGWLGSNLTMPIINVPEVAILTMEAITKRAVVVESPTGDSIAIRPVMNMVLGIDHRANDGAGGAAFLRTVKAWLEGVGPETALY